MKKAVGAYLPTGLKLRGLSPWRSAVELRLPELAGAPRVLLGPGILLGCGTRLLGAGTLRFQEDTGLALGILRGQCRDCSRRAGSRAPACSSGAALEREPPGQPLLVLSQPCPPLAPQPPSLSPPPGAEPALQPRRRGRRGDGRGRLPGCWPGGTRRGRKPPPGQRRMAQVGPGPGPRALPLSWPGGQSQTHSPRLPTFWALTPGTEAVGLLLRFALSELENLLLQNSQYHEVSGMITVKNECATGEQMTSFISGTVGMSGDGRGQGTFLHSMLLIIEKHMGILFLTLTTETTGGPGSHSRTEIRTASFINDRGGESLENKQ
ncbi:uncharacterized protein LOC101708490 [Heterocephalus glaber]|uniref:Uncharacterized protein LOC101708490 n=1 Tax=Heterocephalus glaber TaxID=10181 RepID=A0AAX6R1L8_HETGA|nr:uncharacterized protein LOC101708490 [Heterocephalus glaber]